MSPGTNPGLVPMGHDEQWELRCILVVSVRSPLKPHSLTQPGSSVALAGSEPGHHYGKVTGGMVQVGGKGGGDWYRGGCLIPGEGTGTNDTKERLIQQWQAPSWSTKPRRKKLRQQKAAKDLLGVVDSSMWLSLWSYSVQCYKQKHTGLLGAVRLGRALF